MGINIERVDPLFVREYTKWLLGGQDRVHIYGKVVHLYLRKAMHNINRGVVPTLDIGSIELDFRHQCMGIGTATINYIHCHHNRHATYIENILTKRFHKHLSGEGWITVDPTDYSPSVYKIVRD